MGNWQASDIPDQKGRLVLITGGNSGLGYETAVELARKGAKVVIACRNVEKGKAAAEEAKKESAGGKLSVMELDLADLASIKKFASAFKKKHQKLDLLINNAGVMALPYRKTADGFEMQIGTNHFGHYALTGQLLPILKKTKGARVVNVSSNAHKMGKMRFNDINWERGYGKWVAYGQSKLANLLFTYELQRKLNGIKTDLISVAAHPGYAATNLQFAGPIMADSSFMNTMSKLANDVLAQSSGMGALPTLYAATEEGVQGADYIGPDGLQEMRGYPKKVQSNSRSHNEKDAAQLWQMSEEMTGVKYGL